MVLLMEAVAATGQHVTYRDYMNGTVNEENTFKPIEGRFFDYVQRENYNSLIEFKNKRFFGPMYAKSMPIFSMNQELLCMPQSPKSSDFS